MMKKHQMPERETPLRFELDYSDPNIDLDPAVQEVFSELSSYFITMPKGKTFVDYITFEKGYETLKRHTENFSKLSEETVLAAIEEAPIAFTVFRCILGFSPGEWAYLIYKEGSWPEEEDDRRKIERKVRNIERSLLKKTLKKTPIRIREDTKKLISALIKNGIHLIEKGPSSPKDMLHRLDKIDTSQGLESLQSVADTGSVPYAMLLYERFLGRPFASHRDSVSELVGLLLEEAVKQVLDDAGVKFEQPRSKKGMENPDPNEPLADFYISDTSNPIAVIEAKIAEDPGTARDKISRILNLCGKDYETIACIDGRGFMDRPEEVKKLLRATKGKVFTMKTVHLIVRYTRIRELLPKGNSDAQE